MEYLNITTAFTRSAEYLGSEPVDRGTWLNLAAYCALVENGGLIAGCRDWKDRRCQQVLGITRAEMLRACDLWSWEGNDLRVYAYPVEQEAKVIRKRTIARTNGALGGRPSGTKEETDFGSDLGSRSEPISESVRKEKGREEKGITTTTAREQVEALVAACPRPSHDRPALEAAADTLRRFAGQFTFDQILQAVRAVTLAVRDWPEDERLLYLPTAANFFQKDLWRRHPSDWESRRAAKARAAATNGKPALTDEERAARLGGRA